MQVLVVRFKIKPGFVDAFAQAIGDNARASSQTEVGCRQFDVCRDPQDPQVFFLYELYDDEAAIAAHLKSRHFLQMDATTATWVEEKLVSRYHRVVP